jgi:[acyl-carrier-protein] S-malonyltransferase
VISGEYKAVELACKMKEAGAKRALILPVGGAFHPPMMEPAREELAAAIEATTFQPHMSVYQNVTQVPFRPERNQENLIIQLTAPVKWTQSAANDADGATLFTEVGPEKYFAGLIGKLIKRRLQQMHN